MGWDAALEDTPEGVRILIEVTAGARDERFPDGFNPWRGRIGVRVRAPAQDGRANRAVLSLVAGVLGVTPADVRIVSGSTDSRKAIVVFSMVRARAKELIRPLMREGLP